MTAISPSGGRVLQMGGCCLVAACTIVPVAMSSVSERAHDFAKLLALVPLTIMGFMFVVFALGWRGSVGSGRLERAIALTLGGFIVIAGVTTLVSDSPTLAFIGRFFRPEGFAAWAAYVSAFLGLSAWLRITGRGFEFVDLMLLTSVVPAGYAIQQGFGLDFYATPGIEGRTIGTQGVPGLLGAYLAMMLVVTLDRCVNASQWSVQRVIWVGLAGVQLAGLWLSRARGPMLAALLGIGLLFMLVAVGRRSRLGIWLSVLAIPVALAVVASVNVFEPLQKWAQTVPGLNRVVFDVSQRATQETSLSSRSVISRLGTWDAGNEAFLESSAIRKLFGYGPESAQPHYFVHIPAKVMAAEDYRSVQNFDRLHAHSLDIALNFGLVGWFLLVVFFSAAVVVAANRLYGPAPNSWRELAFTVIALGGGATGLAMATGLGTVAGPAAGLGVAFAWGVYLCRCAIRKANQTHVQVSPAGVAGTLPIAGIVSGIFVFWIDAQVNFALLTGHLAAFSFAALLFGEHTSDRVGADDVAEERPDAAHPQVFEFGVAILLAATLSAFLVPFSSARDLSVQDVLSRLALPLIAWAGATVLCWRRLHCTGRQSLGRWALVTAGAPAAYVLLHIWLRPTLQDGLEILSVERFAALRLGIVGFSLLASLAFGIWLAGPAHVRASSRSWGPITAALASGVVLLACFAQVSWRALVGDVAVGGAHLVARGDRATIDELAEIAVSAAPWEWRHHSDLIYRRLGHALSLLGPGGVPPDRSSEFLRELDKAEVAARRGYTLFASEPWAALALAKVSQVRGLNVLRGYFSESGALAVSEAAELYAKAHRMFPAQPLALHGLAQLHLDNGALAEGYGLLDQMEAIVPNEPEPYFERMAAALRAGDEVAVQATLARAKAKLQPRQSRDLEALAASKK